MEGGGRDATARIRALEVPDEMKIAIVENGPVLLKAERPVSLCVGETRETKQGTIALCRCGQSAKKPFCDGTHRNAGFEAAGGEIDLGE